MVTMTACPICRMPRSFHPECFTAALSWIAHGRYDSPAEYQLARRLRHLAPICYLCGVANTTDIEHVISRHRGGPDTWANIAGACQPCNRRKWHQLIRLTPDQQRRWAGQQATYQAAHGRATVELVSAEYARRTLNDMDLDDGETPDIEWFAEAAADQLETWVDPDETPVTVTVDADHALINFTATGVRIPIFPGRTGRANPCTCVSLSPP